jgi:hypothetical protein
MRWGWVLGLLGCQQPVELQPPGAVSWTGQWTATDVAIEAGAREWLVGGKLKRGRGCTVADLDLDDDLDLILANPANESYILRNESEPGQLEFVPDLVLSADSVVWGYSAADLDGDGDVDLFGAGGGIEGEELDVLLMNQQVETGALSFVEVGESSGVAGPWLGEVQLATGSLEGQWLDYDRDGDLDLWVDETPWPGFSEEPPSSGIEGRNRLLQNQGDGTFVDVAEQVGLDRLASSRFSSWFDLDGDGDLDLHENAMRPSLSATYRHDQHEDGTSVFVEMEHGWGIEGSDARYPDTSFVSATADFNNDGWDDLIKFSRGWPAEESPHRLGHTLFLNAHGQGLVDVTAQSNLNDPFLDGYRDHEANGVMGATARDINGDGLPDVLLGNGGPQAGYPNGLFLTVGLQEVDIPGVGRMSVPRFENYSQLIDVPAEEDVESGLVWPPYPYRTHALCVADFDRDGVQEMYATQGGMQWVAAESAREPDQLFRFGLDPRPRYLEVELHGDGQRVPHTPAFSRIAVYASRGARRWVVRDTLRTVEGFAAQHGEVRWLGLADADHIDRVEIAWTDGTVTVEEDVPLDSRLEVWR